MAEVYNTLAITLGTPPRPDERVKWEYYDRDDKYKSWEGTPLEFYKQYGKRKGMDPGESFSLINDPRNKYEKLYTVDRLGNVWGGRPIRCESAHPHLDLKLMCRCQCTHHRARGRGHRRYPGQHPSLLWLRRRQVLQHPSRYHGHWSIRP